MFAALLTPELCKENRESYSLLAQKGFVWGGGLVCLGYSWPMIRFMGKLTLESCCCGVRESLEDEDEQEVGGVGR